MKRTVVVDAGHGGHDPGGQSTGAPEKTLALRYALRIGRDLQTLGHTVLYTRTGDDFVELSDRARLANDAGADLFVSIHANASSNATARGPWTIHAAGSAEGQRIAGLVQGAMHAVLGGNRGAVFPDASGWTGGRRLAVLRQTRMPAVLLELGFMTNSADLARLEDPGTEVVLSGRIAEAVHAALGGDHREPRAPEVAVPDAGAPDHTADLHLEPIRVPPRPPSVRTVPTALSWGKRVAREIGAEAAARTETLGRALAGSLLDEALAVLIRRLEEVLPAWLVGFLWPLIEGEARKALD